MKTAVLWIITSLVSILVMIVVLCELPRYVRLHCTNPETYLPPANASTNVVVSMPTGQHARKIYGPAVLSLLEQTLMPREVGLEGPDAADVAAQFRHVTAHPALAESDADGLYRALARNKSADTRILRVRPNYVYARDFVSTMTALADANPSCIIIDKRTRASLVPLADIKTAEDVKNMCKVYATVRMSYPNLRLAV